MVIGIAGLLFGQTQARDAILAQVQQTVGEPTASGIRDMLLAVHQSGHGTLATIVGVVVLVFGASGVFSELQDALNTIWKVTPKPGLGLWTVIRDRLLSIVVVLGTGFLLLVSLVVSAAFTAAENYLTPLADRLPGGPSLWAYVNRLISLGFVTLLFALIYKLLPDARLRWRDVWVGAVGSALLFTLGKWLIGLYLGRSQFTSAYGAAASVIVVLTWVYYSAQILLFGAEFTRAYARHMGSHVTPTENAEPVTVAARARQGMLPPEEAAARDGDNVPRPVP
jgi:membrane protein